MTVDIDFYYTERVIFSTAWSAVPRIGEKVTIDDKVYSVLDVTWREQKHYLKADVLLIG